MAVPHNKKKILIVEDEKDFQDLIRELLERHGYEVDAASNGEEGLKRYGEMAPDLVLLDVHLPDMTGFDILRKIRTAGPRPETPVLMCTVRSELSPVTEGLDAGATDYVIKPFNTPDLLERIGAALARASAKG